MSLRDLLYLCPFCGHEPLREEKVVLRCPSCARTYEETVGEPWIRIETSSGETEERLPAELAERIERTSGPDWTERLPESGASARVRTRIASVETPVRRGREVVGFVERRGPKIPGKLSLDSEAVRFEGDRGERFEWPMLEIRAVQGSSSSLQISPRAGGVVTFRFDSASPRRWEDLLKSILRRVWAEAGRGEIVDFQPRIRAGG